MAESTFVRTFLSTLESKAIKIPADYVFDPERVGLRMPYTLPRLQPPHPEMPKKAKQQQRPGASKSITVRLKSARNPAFEFTIASMPIVSTSVEDLKAAVQFRVVDSAGDSVATEKIKILHKRRPVTGKSIAEVLSEEPNMATGGKEIEFSVMIIGGAKVLEPSTEIEEGKGNDRPRKPVAEDNTYALIDDDFWSDLQIYLSQRLQDNNKAEMLRKLFQSAWRSGR